MHELFMPYLGEISALSAAVTWAVGIFFFTAASQRVGSFSMSHYRMLFGCLILFTANGLATGSFAPVGISSLNWFLLGLGGLAGFFLCDVLLFQSCVDVGPRLGVLIFNLYPIAGALLARIFLGEVLSAIAWIGVLTTIAGTVWVVMDKRDDGGAKKYFVRGVFLASGAAVLQAVSFILAKPAMVGADGVHPITATLIRAVFGGAAYWIVSLFRGRVGEIIGKSSDKRALLFIACGAVIGLSLGVYLSMIAIKFTDIGIASAIMALMPVFMLPMSAIVSKERITLRAVIGSFIACLGIAILFNADWLSRFWR